MDDETKVERLEELQRNNPEKFKEIIKPQEPEVINELQIAISSWEGFVLVRFSKSIDQIRMSKKHARDFAHQLLKKAL